MELPRRTRGDELLKPGELTDLISRLRTLAPRHDLRTVIAYAFDHRTRMLPFIYADKRMAPAGVRAIGSAMVASGFEKTRIVLQTWNPNFRPSEAEIDGGIPDILMVSSMQIHSQRCREMIQDACKIEASKRPLIIAGGPKTIYEPWDVFGTDPANPWGADVAVTGEEFVLLSLLEVVLSCRSNNESVRAAFLRARNSGLLDSIPGLVYPRGEFDGVAEELVDTGIQRLLSDLDELPHPVLGYRLLEAPSRWRTGLRERALGPRGVHWYSPIGSLVLTFGCKFACPYCPIPAYNQRQHRLKSPDRIVDEMSRLRKEFGIRYFFGADDNFFNDHDRTRDIIETMARSKIDGKRFYQKVSWGTEVTVHDTIAMKNDLKYVRGAGVQMLWLGVEDITATFVKKGQNVGRTQEAFELLRKNGISPMPMMMHHDTQPLYTRGSNYGLLNQVRLLKKWGSSSLQVLMMTPATGSKLYEAPFNDGMMVESAGGRKVEQHMMDGNFVVATNIDAPWKKQFNIMAAYLYFYNPLQLLKSAVTPKDMLVFTDMFIQFLGMWGVTQTIRRTLGWAWRLKTGKITRRTSLPASRIPLRNLAGEAGCHDLPRPAQKGLIQLSIKPSLTAGIGAAVAAAS